MFTRIVITTSVVLTLAACSTAPDKIDASYVSPAKYTDYNCNQLARESQRVNREVDILHGKLNKEYKKDQVATAVGLVIFWPALFLLAGPKADESGYARLKGDAVAVQEAQIKQNCDF